MWWLKNVIVVDPSQKLSGKQDVLVEGQKILAVGSSFHESEVRQRAQGQEFYVIEGEGKYLFPGFVDVHTHLREPGQEDKETILTGARAAVRGGFTSILAMANTVPVIDLRGLVEFVRLQGQRAGYAKVYPIGCVTKGMQGQELVEMLDLAEGGAVGFSDDGHPVDNPEVMRLALEYAKLTGLPIIAHCEDRHLAQDGCMRKGERAMRLGLKGIPASAESVMVARDVLLAEETGGKLHIAHVSTKESVEIIRQAKQRGVDVTAEVNPHHLIFCDENIELTSTSLKVNPPLGTSEDREVLIEALADGTIDMLATDHAPHLWEEKTRTFADAPFGIAGLETAVAAVWQELVCKGKLSVERFVEAWSLSPARRFKLAGGSLIPGGVADLMLFDPEYTETIGKDTLESKGKNTPFLGKTLKGFPVMTWVSGKLVQEDRKVIG